MSFSLSISGHHGDADPVEVENLVREKAREVVDALSELGQSVHVSFSGATGPGLEPVAPVVAESAQDEPAAEPEPEVVDELDEVEPDETPEPDEG